MPMSWMVHIYKLQCAGGVTSCLTDGSLLFLFCFLRYRHDIPNCILVSTGTLR